MRARFEAYVHRGLRQQAFVLRPYRGESVDLGVAFAAPYVVALAYYAPVVTNNHRAHHGVRLGVLPSVGRQLQATAHVENVLFKLFHNAKVIHIGEVKEVIGVKEVKDKRFCG